jgi:hypothetical protein
MTSATIVILLFAFGALTYFTVQHDPSNDSGEFVAGPLSHRMLSMSLNSEDGDRAARVGLLNDEIMSDMNSSLEIEGSRPSSTR